MQQSRGSLWRHLDKNYVYPFECIREAGRIFYNCCEKLLCVTQELGENSRWVGGGLLLLCPNSTQRWSLRSEVTQKTEVQGLTTETDGSNAAIIQCWWRQQTTDIHIQIWNHGHRMGKHSAWFAVTPIHTSVFYSHRGRNYAVWLVTFGHSPSNQPEQMGVVLLLWTVCRQAANSCSSLTTEKGHKRSKFALEFRGLGK